LSFGSAEQIEDGVTQNFWLAFSMGVVFRDRLYRAKEEGKA
jgi:hypothetical protein